MTHQDPAIEAKRLRDHLLAETRKLPAVDRNGRPLQITQPDTDEQPHDSGEVQPVPLSRASHSTKVRAMHEAASTGEPYEAALTRIIQAQGGMTIDIGGDAA